MKKVFIDHHEIILFEKRDGVAPFRYIRNKLPFTISEVENKKQLITLVHEIESNTGEMNYLIGTTGKKKAEELFFSDYRQIIAAGGVVKNPQGKILMMFRRGKWDLPKGKLDKGESLRKAAVRETNEETGVGKLKIMNRIKFFDGRQECTYHTYMLNGRHVIKATYWYEMFSNDKSPLTPQAAEGITEVGWYTRVEIREHLKNSFRSVEWVLNECGIK